MPLNYDPVKPLLLVFPFEQLAHYLRCITLAKKLQPYFEIRFSYSQRYASFIDEAGFEMFGCETIDADSVLDCVKRFDFSWMNAANLERVYLSQIQVIDTLQPAVVLGDTMPTLKMATATTDVPFVSLFNGYMSRYYAGVRKMSWRFPLYKWFSFLPELAFDAITQQGESLSFQKIHHPFATLREKYGLLKKFTYPDELEGDLNLICDLSSLFPQQPLPQHYQLVPPLIYESGQYEKMAPTKTTTTKKTLFVSMGSTGDWESVRFLSNTFFSKYNIITAGDSRNILQAPHITALPFVNVQTLFPQVDLVLCHGGNGTIYQALRYGIPLLCKTTHFEQEWNVHALEKNGLGKSLDAVHLLKDYDALISEWMKKKGTTQFEAIRQNLNEASEQFESTIAAIRNLIKPTGAVVHLPKHQLAR